MELSGNQFDNIGAVLAAVVATALALSGALGPSIMLLTEAIKSANPYYRNGNAGILSVGVSVVICGLLGALTSVLGTDNGASGFFTLVFLGAFVGVFVGAGAIRSYKTAGTINTETSAAVNVMKSTDSDSGWDDGYAYGLMKSRAEEVRKIPSEPEDKNESTNQPAASTMDTETDTHVDESGNWSKWTVTDSDQSEFDTWPDWEDVSSDDSEDDSESEEVLRAAVECGPVADEGHCSITPDEVEQEDTPPPRRVPAITYTSASA